jgi:hypothetical protein
MRPGRKAETELPLSFGPAFTLGFGQDSKNCCQAQQVGKIELPMRVSTKCTVAAENQ